MTDRTVATLKKNRRDQLRVSLSEFNGHDLVNLRIWAPDGGGDMVPTRTGLAVRVGLLPELIEALQLAEAQARREGLLATSEPSAATRQRSHEQDEAPR